MNFYYPGLYIHKGYIQPMIQEHLGSHHIEEENTQKKKKKKEKPTISIHPYFLTSSTETAIFDEWRSSSWRRP